MPIHLLTLKPELYFHTACAMVFLKPTDTKNGRHAVVHSEPPCTMSDDGMIFMSRLP